METGTEKVGSEECPTLEATRKWYLEKLPSSFQNKLCVFTGRWILGRDYGKLSGATDCGNDGGVALLRGLNLTEPSAAHLCEVLGSPGTPCLDSLWLLFQTQSKASKYGSCCGVCLQNSSTFVF